MDLEGPGTPTSSGAESLTALLDQELNGASPSASPKSGQQSHFQASKATYRYYKRLFAIAFSISCRFSPCWLKEAKEVCCRPASEVADPRPFKKPRAGS